MTDRLNSPELIDFYESRNFSYKKEYIMDNTLSAYIHTSGIYKKGVYLDNYPYYGEGYGSR